MHNWDTYAPIDVSFVMSLIDKLIMNYCYLSEFHELESTGGMECYVGAGG